MRTLRNILIAPLILVAAIVLLLEDWLWDDLARIAAWIGRIPVFRSVERFIIWLPPYPALLVFAAPSLLLIPLKFAAVYLIAHKQATLGLVVAITAKLIGTALVARIFNLTQPKLVQIPWFNWLYVRVSLFRARVYATVKATRAYALAHNAKLRIIHAVRSVLPKRGGGLSRLWLAVLRRARKARRAAN